jgi:tetratricopeptide (TPR) repeat protein
MTLAEVFESALKHHQAGRLLQAQPMYRQIIAQVPGHAGAIHFLGLSLHQSGQSDAGLALMQQSIQLAPAWPMAHCNIGNVFKDRGLIDQSIAAYLQAITLDPHFAEAFINLAIVLKDRGDLRGAIAAYRQAVALRPADARRHFDLGTALQAAGLLDDSVPPLRKAIELDPHFTQAFSVLGLSLMRTGRLAEAVEVCRAGVTANPGFGQGWSNLGTLLTETGELQQAVAAYQRAIAIDPQFAGAYSNLANALRELGQWDESIQFCRKAIALASDYAQAHWNLAFVLLLTGDFQSGWREYEWRWKIDKPMSPPRNFPQPMWDGSALNGKTLLLHTEQGFGDAIQFFRYVTIAAQKGGRIILESHSELKRLFEINSPGLQVVGKNEPLPAFDVHCPLISLPMVFGTDLQSIPPQLPALQADPDLSAAWKARLDAEVCGLRAGLVWAGSKTHPNDRNRSISLSDLAELLDLPNITFISLQKGDAAVQSQKAGQSTRLIDWTKDLHDFSDTAALVANLDLVITIDSSVAHLAGAMGKPTWVLLPFAPDWRWLLDRQDSPWYPQLRLLRQSIARDWPGVVRRVREALEPLIAARSSRDGLHQPR